ncbi:BT1A1 protein, partial [Todus mexicanus]|nr:BT1A1 protein [Todus mexicanus]
VTLDPDTAHPQLVLSEDLRRVKRQHIQQNLPENPKRFIYWCSVLGREGFREGRHCWEVEVQGKVGGDSWWAVGVARTSVNRSELVDLTPGNGVWAVEHFDGTLWTLTFPST